MMESELTPAQKQIVDLAAEFYATYKASPSMRALINLLKERDPEHANSIYVHTLFPKGIAEIAELAGIPKSSRCI